MGRGRIATEPLDIETIQQAFAVTSTGALIRLSTNEPAVFRGPKGQPLVRVYVGGKIKRVSALRIAWAIHANEWPRGVVRLRSDGDGYLESNLLLTPANRDPFSGAISGKHSRGGKASALHERANAATTLLQTLSAHPGSTLPQISKLVGSSKSCTCVRLSKLADAGICIGPKCDARARWDLSQKGRELAARTIVVLDDLDHDILRIIARSQTKLMKIVAQTGVCRLTARRRVNLMVERKLIESDGRRFSITDEGRKARGDAAPQPWVRPEAVAASLSRDVRTRLQHPNDDRSSWARAEQSSRARQKGIEKARENGQQPFIDALTEFDRLRA
jgi:hypothetical protein